MSTIHERDLELATDQYLSRFPNGWPTMLLAPNQYLEVTNAGDFKAGKYLVKIDAGKLEATIEPR